MPVSMKDVAQAAGVTEGTVSRALADSPRVNSDTRLRIQQIAREMGYVPSAIARGLAVRRTNTLGVMISDFGDPFISKLMLSVDREALQQGYSVILSSAGTDPEREVSAIRLLLEQRVDAVIVLDPLVADSSLPQLEHFGVPLVLLNRKRYPYSVGTDNVAAGKLAVDYLLDLGHRRVAYIGGNRSEEESRDRQAGYELALSMRGVPGDPALIATGEGAVRSGERGLEQLLGLDDPPTAVFCFNDITAAGALLYAYHEGLHVPRDLSIVGFDDSMAAYFVPPVTTVAQDVDELARLSLQMALHLLAGQEAPQTLNVPGKLIVRQSTAQPGKSLATDGADKSRQYPLRWK